MIKIFFHLSYFILIITMNTVVLYTQDYGPLDIGIKEILIYGKTIPDSMYQEAIKNKKITLNYKVKDITFKWIESDTIDIKDYTFAFILEGFEKEFNYLSYERKARYTNLDPGLYRFRIKYAYKELWHEPGEYIDLELKAPWWNTWQLKIIVLIIIIMIIRIYIKNKIKEE